MKDCRNCLYYDECQDHWVEPCDDFCPLDDAVDDIIENGRTVFYGEWFDYIEDNSY